MNTMYRIIIFIICNLVYTSHVFSQSPAKNATQFYEEGLKFKNETKCNEAIVSYKKALKLKPDHKESLYETGWCYNELGKSEEALTYLLQAKKVWGNEPKVFLDTGYAYYQLKKDADAILNYNKCLELNNEYSLAYKYLGDVYYSRQDYSKALENYKRPWCDCYIDFQEEFGIAEVSMVEKSKTLGEIRRNFIKYLNLPTIYEFALSSEIAR